MDANGYKMKDGRCLRFRPAESCDMEQVRALWKQSFHDSDTYMAYYFSKVASRNSIFVAKWRDTVVSMIHLNPYRLTYRNENDPVQISQTESLPANKQGHMRMTHVNGGYIVGVATLPAYRRQGIMAALMQYVLSCAKKMGIAVVYLMPESDAYYKSSGFKCMETSRFVEFDCVGDGQWRKLEPETGSLMLRKLEELRESDWELFEQRLAETYDLFACRDKAYLEDLQCACLAMRGDVTVVCDSDGILAVYGTMIEAGAAELVQYISAEPSLRALIFGIREQHVRRYGISEVFGTIAAGIPDGLPSKPGHGIMFQVLCEEQMRNFTSKQKLLINEVV